MAVSAWTANPYPRARSDRKAAGVQQIAGEFVPQSRTPTVTLWSVQLRSATANVRAQVASRRFLGPCLVKRITGHYSLIGASSNTLSIVGIYHQPSPYADVVAGSGAASPGGTSFFELKLGGEQVYSAPGAHGFTHNPGSADVQAFETRLDKILTDPEVYLAVFVENRNAGPEARMDAIIQVYEGVDPSWFASLLA